MNKNRHISFLLILLLLFGLAAIGCYSKSQDEGQAINLDETEKIKIPIYTGAKNIKKYTLMNGLAIGVKYEAKVFHPAESVINFYEKEMLKINFTPYIEEDYKYADRKWNFYRNSIIKGKPDVASLSMSWVNSNKQRRAMLSMQYYFYGFSRSPIYWGNNNDLFLSFQIMPFENLPSEGGTGEVPVSSGTSANN